MIDHCYLEGDVPFLKFKKYAVFEIPIKLQKIFKKNPGPAKNLAGPAKKLAGTGASGSQDFQFLRVRVEYGSRNPDNSGLEDK